MIDSAVVHSASDLNKFRLSTRKMPTSLIEQLMRFIDRWPATLCFFTESLHKSAPNLFAPKLVSLFRFSVLLSTHLSRPATFTSPLQLGVMRFS